MLATSTLSPLQKELVTAASMPPEPDDVSKKTSFSVLYIFLSFSETCENTSPNSGDLWCMRLLPCSMSTSSDMGVGPGVMIYFFTIFSFFPVYV